MEYRVFFVEMLKGRALTRLGDADQTERTLQTYFQAIDGKSLTADRMPLAKGAFWFGHAAGYNAGFSDASKIVRQVQEDLRARE